MATKKRAAKKKSVIGSSFWSIVASNGKPYYESTFKTKKEALQKFDEMDSCDQEGAQVLEFVVVAAGKSTVNIYKPSQDLVWST